MKLLKYPTGLFLFLLIISCTGKNNPVIEFTPLQFSDYQPLPAYDVIADSMPFFTSQMIIKDSLIIMKGKDSESCFSIYNKNTGERIKSFYKMGKGPGEGIYPSDFTYVGNDNYLVLETNLRKWVYIDIKKLLNDEDPYREIKMKFPEDRDIIMITFFMHYKDNQFIANSPFNLSERFKKICIGEGEKKEDVNLYRTYPQVIDDTEDYNKVIFCSVNQLAMNPDKTKLVDLTLIGAIGQTFDVESDTMKLRATKAINHPMYEKDPSPKNIWLNIKNDGEVGFTCVFATDDYIYAIYSGVHAEHEWVQKRIVVFDWDLNHIKTYKSDNIIIEIAKDFETGDVYGVIKNKNTSEYQLVRFKEKFAV